MNPLLVELFAILQDESYTGTDEELMIIHDIIDDFEDILFDMYTDDEMTEDDIYDITEEIENFALEYYDIVRILHQNNIDMALERIQQYCGGGQRTLEWYLTRHSMLTASIAYDVMNVDLAKKRGMSVIRGKLTLPQGIQDENIDSPTAKQSKIPSKPDAPHVRGTRYEPIIRNLYSKLNEDVPISEYECIPHQQYSYIGASPDGIITDGPSKGKMIEIKCPQPHSAYKDGTTVREEYWHQIQVQLNVCDLEECDYVRAIVYDSPTISGVLEIMKQQQEQRILNCNGHGHGNGNNFQTTDEILTMGTVWMDGISGEYIYESPGMFATDEMIHTRPHSMPVFIRHYFILRRDWLVLSVKRNRHWFETRYVPQATIVWNEILKARENPSEWMEKHPVNRRTTVGRVGNYSFDNTVSVFKDFDED